MLKNKLNIILTSVKVLFSLFFTCLILTKGDAGSLVHNIGSFFVGGNSVVGVTAVANATLLYILAMYNLSLNSILLKGFKRFLLIFDISLAVINSFLGIYIATVCNQMPLDDAISKYIILTVGAAVVCYAISLFVMLLISKQQSNLQDNLPKTLDENNNPFTFTNRITRKPYLITKILMLIIFIIGITSVNHLNLNEYVVLLLKALITFITFGIGLFAASKRLRDIKWSQLFLIIWTIPLLGLIIGFPLLFVPTKQTNN